MAIDRRRTHVRMRRYVHRKGTSMTKRSQPDVRVVPGINLDFRPRHYWADRDPVSTIVQNIKGQNRREMIRSYVTGATPQMVEMNDHYLDDTLDARTRSALGSTHPSFLGGEFLPDYGLREVEIARVVLDSVTRDVMSLRAATNRKGTRIVYRMVDEYNSEYFLSQKSSRRPLSLRELIAILDATTSDTLESLGEPFVENFASWQVENGTAPADAVNSALVESVIYPELGLYYVARLASWAAEAERQRELDSTSETSTDDDEDDADGFIITGWRPPSNVNPDRD